VVPVSSAPPAISTSPDGSKVDVCATRATTTAEDVEGIAAKAKAAARAVERRRIVRLLI